MSHFEVAPTDRSPLVKFDFAQHVLEIRGESYPEDVHAFYGPVFQSLQCYLDGIAGEVITVEIELIYFNSSSAKVLMRLFDRLEECAARDNTVIVNWYYVPDDDSIKSAGEMFAEDLTRVKLRLREVQPKRA
jgi:hypothetical protein